MKGFCFLSHANKCSDCKQFVDSFGKDSLEWYISYFNKIQRLDLRDLGGKKYPSNEIRHTISDYFSGTKMTLIFHELPTNKTELSDLLGKALSVEDYKKACILRDLINE